MRTLSTILAFAAFFIANIVTAGSGVASDPKNICPIKVGESLPSLTLKDIDGEAFDLNKAVGEKPSVLIFYRGSWCPYCNTHLGELQTVEAELKKLGYQIIAVSPDLPKNLKTSVEKNKLSYRLVSDSKAEAAKAFGLAFKVDDETYKKYLGYKIDLESASGERHHILPAPAAVVVDTSGKVRFTFASPDYKVRVDSEVLLAAAKAAL